MWTAFVLRFKNCGPVLYRICIRRLLFFVSRSLTRDVVHGLCGGAPVHLDPPWTRPSVRTCGCSLHPVADPLLWTRYWVQSTPVVDRTRPLGRTPHLAPVALLAVAWRLTASWPPRLFLSPCVLPFALYQEHHYSFSRASLQRQLLLLYSFSSSAASSRIGAAFALYQSSAWPSRVASCCHIQLVNTRRRAQG